LFILCSSTFRYPEGVAHINYPGPRGKLYSNAEWGGLTVGMTSANGTSARVHICRKNMRGTLSNPINLTAGLWEAPHACRNGIGDDCDGFTDAEDDDCKFQALPPTLVPVFDAMSPADATCPTLGKPTPLGRYGVNTTPFKIFQDTRKSRSE
jgi:hypothetical protein